MGFAEKKLAIVLGLLQIVYIALFAIFAGYGDPVVETVEGEDALHPTYPMFQDIHIMIFIGFGFLMTFLKRYGYSAVGYNFLLATLALQWAILVQGLIRHGGLGFKLDIVNLVEGDFAAAAVLITMGALLGKTSPLQLVVISVLEVVFYSVNIMIGIDILGAVDAGGSMFIHTFGAYFGLGCAMVLKAKWYKDAESNSSEYHNDLFAMIGTLFLWVCWPSFNAALLPAGDQQHRGIVNSYFSLACSVTFAFLTSVLVNRNNKLDIVHIQNATLAGGVAIGACADFMVNPFGAMVIGSVSGIISVLGYRFLTPWLTEKIGLHDTCGVHNLHGMPGVFAGICSIVAAAIANPSLYGSAMKSVFPRVGPSGAANGTVGRTAGEQAGMQAAALGITLAIAIVGGIITGLILKLGVWEQLLENEGFEDEPYWELPQTVNHLEVPQKDGAPLAQPEQISETDGQTV